MSAPLQSFVGWLLRSLPVNQPRPCQETMADWRREAAHARGFGRLAAGIRGVWSVARCVLMISASELRSPEILRLFLRIAVLSLPVLAAAAILSWNQSVRNGDGRVSILLLNTAAGGVLWTVALMPLLALISGAMGRRLTSPAPRLGPAIGLGLLMFIVTGWIVPAFNMWWRDVIFGIGEGRGRLLPGVNERSIVELVPMLFSSRPAPVVDALNLRLLLTVSAAVFVGIGITVRSMGGLQRVAGAVLPIVTFLLPLSAPLQHSTVFVLMWPALLAAVLITRALVRTNSAQQALS